MTTPYLPPDQFPTESLEYVVVTLSANSIGLPTEMAIVPYETKPTGDDWSPAVRDGREAMLLIGLGSDRELLAGTYDVWWRLTANPERPAANSGQILVV